jgi:hypothetical protein
VRPKRIVSGGQTGADRAALDVAIERGVAHGGYCPRGRRAEDGRIPDRYQLTELPSPAYPARTEANVRTSDGTLLVTRGPATGGSKLTADLARKHRKPVLAIDLAETDLATAAATVRRWLDHHAIDTLNVAGPRASTTPRIYDDVRSLLGTVITS